MPWGIIGSVTKSETFDADSNKIERHQTPIKQIKISLTELCNNRGYVARVSLPELGDSLYNNVGQWSSREEAEKGFPQVVEKMRRGEYKLHVYDNGKVELEL